MGTPSPPPPVEDFTLPAAGSDLNLGSLIIHKAARPYVEQWFAETARASDTPAKFLLRMIYTAAAQHRAAKLRAANTGEPRDFDPDDPSFDPDDPATHPTTHEGQKALYQHTVQTDLTAALDALETILP